VNRFATIVPLRSSTATAPLVLLAQLCAMARVVEPPAPPKEHPAFEKARARRAEAIARTLGGGS
jgi:hypothetical protein